jgi:hypothetical protein
MIYHKILKCQGSDSGGLPCQRRSEKAILPNEAKVGLTGLISNGLAGVPAEAAGSRMYFSSVIIRVFSPFVQTHYSHAFRRRRPGAIGLIAVRT